MSKEAGRRTRDELFTALIARSDDSVRVGRLCVLDELALSTGYHRKRT